MQEKLKNGTLVKRKFRPSGSHLRTELLSIPHSCKILIFNPGSESHASDLVARIKPLSEYFLFGYGFSRFANDVSHNNMIWFA